MHFPLTIAVGESKRQGQTAPRPADPESKGDFKGGADASRRAEHAVLSTQVVVKHRTPVLLTKVPASEAQTKRRETAAMNSFCMLAKALEARHPDQVAAI